MFLTSSLPAAGRAPARSGAVNIAMSPRTGALVATVRTRPDQQRRPASLRIPLAPEKSAAQVLAQERAGPRQRGIGLVEHRGEPLEHVGDVGRALEGHRDIFGGGARGQPGGVVEKDLVRSGLDEQWRQSGQVGEDRADPRRGRVACSGVVRRSALQPRGRERGIQRTFSVMLAPDRVRSAHGDMRTAALG
jgi:hypothetical protein